MLDLPVNLLVPDKFGLYKLKKAHTKMRSLASNCSWVCT